MVMKVATVDVLADEAHFEPHVARAIAKAIEMEIGGSQQTLATKHDLSDLRSNLRDELLQLRVEMREGLLQLRVEMREEFSQIRIEMRDQKAEVVRWVFLAVMGQTAVFTGAMYLLLQYAR